MLKQQGLNEKQIRESLAQDLIDRKLTLPPTARREHAARPGRALCRAAARKAQRRDRLPARRRIRPQGAAPRSRFAGLLHPNRERFIRPERRVLRYATFGEEALKSVAAAIRCRDRRAL